MRYQYSKTQFNKAVEFISNNNKYFLGETEEITATLSGLINDLMSRGNDCWYVGTMGLQVFRSLESTEDEPEMWMIEIFVDPSVSCAHDNEDDYFDSSNLN